MCKLILLPLEKRGCLIQAFLLHLPLVCTNIVGDLPLKSEREWQGFISAPVCTVPGVLGLHPLPPVTILSCHWLQCCLLGFWMPKNVSFAACCPWRHKLLETESWDKELYIFFLVHFRCGSLPASSCSSMHPLLMSFGFCKLFLLVIYGDWPLNYAVRPCECDSCILCEFVVFVIRKLSVMTSCNKFAPNFPSLCLWLLVVWWTLDISPQCIYFLVIFHLFVFLIFSIALPSVLITIRLGLGAEVVCFGV
jgi:hypothetical protein